MLRDVIQIDEDKCIGCGLCVGTCHQGALELVDGKAKVVSEDYCDGLGRCLPNCPTDALMIVQKEVSPKPKEAKKTPPIGGCPGTMQRTIKQEEPESEISVTNVAPVSQLANWPVQLALVSVTAPYLEGCDLLIAADCTAFAYGNFHQEFLQGKVCLIGCPKLDTDDYAEKLQAILENNTINSITVLRMEVPCCGGIVEAVKSAVIGAGHGTPWGFKTISLEGKLLD